MAVVSPTDSVFLWGESRTNPTHVLGLQLFEPPEDAGPDWVRAFVEEIRSHAEVKTAFRRRPHRSWDTAGFWSWEVDDEVDLDVHVRHVGLPSPARIRELLEYVAMVHGTLLDVSRPLWEFHVVEGLADGRMAVCSKLHHSLFDGVTMGRHLVGGLSTDRTVRTCTPPWARATPSDAPATGSGLLERLRGGLDTVGQVATDVPALVRSAWGLLTDEDTPVPFEAPPSVLNVPITGTRRFAGDQWPSSRLRAVARKAGTTSNDVALAMCGGALRRYLLDRDALPEHSLVAMVPVSLRGRDGDGGDDRGNAFGAVLAELGTDLDEPAERLARVRRSVDAGKERLAGLHPLSSLLLGGLTMGGAFLDLVPGVHTPRPAFNLIVSSVPLTRETMYWNGARMTDIYPMSMVFDGQALNITIAGHDDALSFGLTGCHAALPHLQHTLRHLEDELAALEGHPW